MSIWKPTWVMIAYEGVCEECKATLVVLSFVNTFELIQGVSD